ncbi:MAG: NAD-dependent epimerase/dehydratase family protein [Treponema sp.]|jgi:nucleoside-diphosphate-sugar epimerase|nr:NAD-dependent epimerase/dehydratase family protein [Treponema sp.]
MSTQKKALVCGAGGFIGGYLVKRLKEEGYFVCGVDIKHHEYRDTDADEFIQGDLREQNFCRKITSDIQFDELYQLAADMGGAGYIFTGEHDAVVMHNSATINLNIVEEAKRTSIKKIFYSSSACIYPERIQKDANNPGLKETDAYPAGPDSEYGWEKLFSERLYMSYARNYGMEIHIARFHNIFGPYGTWTGGREKAPAAMCRKVAATLNGGEIEIWGDGEQTRTFLYIDECLEGVRHLMESTTAGPVNIGSNELISINNLANMAMTIAGKKLTFKHIPGPLGVRGRSSDNTYIQQVLGWKPTAKLIDGMKVTYNWIAEQVTKQNLSIK